MPNTYLEDVKNRLAAYADANLGLRGYEDYISDNLGAALDVLHLGGNMYDLDERVMLKQVLHMTIPSFLHSGISRSSETSLTEYDEEGIEELFYQYVGAIKNGHNNLSGGNQKNGLADRISCNACSVSTPAGTITASRELDRVRFWLNEEDRDLAVVREGQVRVYEPGIGCGCKTVDLKGFPMRSASDPVLAAAYYDMFRDRAMRKGADTALNKKTKKARKWLLNRVLPSHAAALAGRYPGEALDVFAHGGSEWELYEILALEEALEMDVPYWMYLYMRLLSRGMDFVMAPSRNDIISVFGSFADHVEKAPKAGTFAQELTDDNNVCMSFPYGAARIYPSADPNNPGIYMEVLSAGPDGKDGLWCDYSVLVEYTDDEGDLDGGHIIARIWADPGKEDYTDRLILRDMEQKEDPTKKPHDAMAHED